MLMNFMKKNNFPFLAASLYEGTFSVGLDKVFNPMERTGKPDRGALRISIQPFLIKDQERLMLFDAGLGEFGNGTSIQTLISNLAEYGVEPFEVTDIFISHLHYDHIGGLAHRENGYWELTFEEAAIWMNKNEYGKAISKELFYDDEKTDFLHFIATHANLGLLSAGEKATPHVTFETVGGHTEFSQTIWYENGTDKFVQAGDVLPTKGHVNQKFAAKYDFDAKQSIKARQAIAKRAYEEEFTILAYHSSETAMFRLIDLTENGYTIQSVDTYEHP